MNHSETDALVERIRAEYLEMPGMTLRVEQVARLCGIERSACLRVLDALVATEFLWQKADGAYARRGGDVMLRPTSRQHRWTPVTGA